MRSKKAIKNICISLLQQIVTVICGFIAPRMIIQSFGSNVNGLISSITQFLGYITLLESGIGPVIKSALYKPLANNNNNQIANIIKASERFFRKIGYIFIIYLVILCMLYPIIMNNQFDSLFTISLVIIISISIFAEYYFGMTYKLFLQAKQETYIASGMQIICTVLNTIIVVILIKLRFSIQIVKIASAFIFVLRPILQNMYVRKKYRINFDNVDDNYNLKQKWDGLAQHIAAVVHNNTDVAVLTFFTSMAEVSVYAVHWTVVKGIKNLVQAFTGGIDASFGDMIAKGEKEHLRKSFNTYELFYFSIITIIFISTLILIVPFIKVYTKGVTDADYIRPVFAFLIVMSEFMHSIRLPYSSITLAAGHFKETRIGAWFEAGINIVLSVILVMNFGIIGVAIGTLIAMTIRTIEFIIHTSKHILGRKISYSFIRIFIVLMEVIVVYVINAILFANIEVTTYISWIIYAILILGITSIVTFIINFIVYKKDFIQLFSIVKNIKNKK